MKTLTDTRNELKELIPQGIDLAIKGIKAVIAEGTDKYNDLILIEGRYQHMTRQLIQGIVGDEASQVEFNKIRKDLLAFIDGLEATHLTSSAGKGSDGRPDIYNGEVFYRIPNEMQKEVETKCLVRLAFDRKIIMEDLEKADGDILKDIRISEVMGVELLDPAGKAFEIRTLHDTVQFMEKDLYTEWVFYVKPILEGLHNLILKISIIEIKNGIERKRNVVLEEQVNIITTVPEKSGAAEEMQSAGLALAVAQGQQSGQVMPPPAPAPAPKGLDVAPKHRARNFRKIASTLSMLAVLVVATWMVFLKDDKGSVEPNPGDVAMMEKKAWNVVKEDPTPTKIRDFIRTYPESKLHTNARAALDSIENVTWESALASNDPKRLEDFMDKFPESARKSQASRILKDLKNPATHTNEVNAGEEPASEPPGNKPSNPNTSVNTPSNVIQTPNPATGGNVNNSITTNVLDTNEPVPLRSAFRKPVYRGCKNDNDKSREEVCTKSKISTFIKRNLRYPERAKAAKIEGTVVVEFIVEKNGQISGVQFNNDIGGDCGKEAVRLVKQLPDFEPGLNRAGRPVRVQYSLPITFKLR